MTLLEAVTGTSVDGRGEIDLLPAAAAEALRLLPEGRRYVGLAPGASQRTRCWPLERFIALACWIEAQAWQPVLLLGPDERDFLAPLREALPRALFPGCGEGDTLNDVELALAFGRRFSAAVSHDTGTGHCSLASARHLSASSAPAIPNAGVRSSNRQPRGTCESFGRAIMAEPRSNESLWKQ